MDPKEPSNENEEAGRSAWENEDGTTDWGAYEEEYGRDAVLDELAHHPDDASLEEYVNESDVSCTNEELGRDENGEREDA
jgi:hypothetical protein